MSSSASRILALLTATAVTYKIISNSPNSSPSVPLNLDKESIANSTSPEPSNLLTQSTATQPTVSTSVKPTDKKTETVPAKKVMTSADFNASQNQEEIKKCLDALEIRQKSRLAGKTPTNDADICTVELFRFLNCPYCAKVKGVLDYNDVPYRTVTVDPLTNNHMPNTPYSMAPQIQFVTNPSAPIGSVARGPFVVDSDLIVSTLSHSLGFSNQLEDGRVKETLTFISNAYSRASFIAMYSDLNRAMESYRHCVPEHYQLLPLRIAGAKSMSFIAMSKAFPKLKEHFSVADGESIDSVLQRQTQFFLDRISTYKPSPVTATRVPYSSFFGLKKTQPVETFDTASSSASHPPQFHGGEKPDIADVQMFAMSQSILSNPLCSKIINKGGFQEWATKMAPLMPNRSLANYGCEMPRL